MSHQSDLIASDIHEYLAQHERKELLRFLTCGNVDDGKSTLIGRLLHDSKMIYEDQLAAIRKDSAKFGTTGDDFDPALLLDGLQAEREQGITIDVAYRYFSTTRRKFIIADTPGHEQYTRNMATGASTCDLAIILIDARHGVQTQTRRHSYIVSLLGIRHVIIAVNKMDLMDYSEGVFEQIRNNYLTFVEPLGLHDVHFIPLSALKGDNVVNPSAHMPWYQGPALMTLLDSIEIAEDQNFVNPRFPVQYVNRPNLNFRGYSGTVAAGIFRKGDPIMALPSRKTSRIASIVNYDGEQAEAFPPQSVTFTLEDEIDISRGDMLVRSDDLPQLESRVLAHIVWMTEAPLLPGRQYTIKHNTRVVTGSVADIRYRIDVNTQDHHPSGQLNLNEIGLCEMALNAPIAFDPYTVCKSTGSFIIIDRLTNVTIGAGIILGPVDGAASRGKVTDKERSARFGQKPVTLWLSGATRSSLAYALERSLFDLGHAAMVLDDPHCQPQVDTMAKQICRTGLICICTLGNSGTGDAASNIEVAADSITVEALLQQLRNDHILLA
ncbi:MAG: sulfate adenylyltransferase subunit CysN [Methylococcaceae bacterium]|jgi:bifunctional enzyme CysN/CysC